MRAPQLRIVWGEQPVRVAATDWSRRCVELVGHTLPEAGAEHTGALVREAVNAA
ncbi:hypothetical protein ACF09H_31750 [Streptomyces sp. NPDC014983]|uniref:hypothetical protein n=1 Tax=Streptomyces sp. NPDC014983 TaxID=3364933 RepID=UPI0036F68712